MLQTQLNGVMNLGDNLFAIFACGFHRFPQTPVTQGIHGGKTQVFEFNTDIINAQTLGYGGVDIQSFSGDSAALLW